MVLASAAAKAVMGNLFGAGLLLAGGVRKCRDRTDNDRARKELLHELILLKIALMMAQPSSRVKEAGSTTWYW